MLAAFLVAVTSYAGIGSGNSIFPVLLDFDPLMDFLPSLFIVLLLHLEYEKVFKRGTGTRPLRFDSSPCFWFAAYVVAVVVPAVARSLAV